MSYKISYGKPVPMEKSAGRKKWPLVLLISVGVLWIAAYFCGDALQPYKEAFFPWTRPEVRSALYSMTEEIGLGAPVGDAVVAFCEEIVHGAG